MTAFFSGVVLLGNVNHIKVGIYWNVLLILS